MAVGEGQGKRAARSSFQQSEGETELLSVEVVLLALIASVVLMVLMVLLVLVLVVLLPEVELAFELAKLVFTPSTEETVVVDVFVEAEGV